MFFIYDKLKISIEKKRTCNKQRFLNTAKYMRTFNFFFMNEVKIYQEPVRHHH